MDEANIYEQPVVFTNLPSVEELCHVIVSIDPKEKKDSSVKSDFQWQLLKTRILIFSDVELIASPMSEELKCIHVVCKCDFFKSGSLSKLLEKNRLKFEVFNKLSQEVYKLCFMYSLISRLAPAWNRIEKIFIEGRYFLMKRGQLDAVELNCFISGNSLYLYCCPIRLWLTEIDLFDFDLPRSVLEHSISEKFYKDLSHSPYWVHVLPSFKRGRIVYVTNCIPEKSTFKNYQEMRRHWKNTYGLRLPEEGSSMIYVGVNFFGPLDFTYPIVCVRRGMHYNIGDPKLVLNFANSINSRSSIVCGSKLKLSSLGCYQVPHHFLIENETKWNERNILSLEKRILENFLCDYGKKMNDESQISLSTSYQQTSLNVPSKVDDSADDWFVKCSSFIDGLAQFEPKRIRLKAADKPLFSRNPRQFFSKSLQKPLFFNNHNNNVFKEKETSGPIVTESLVEHFTKDVSTSSDVHTYGGVKNVVRHKPVFLSNQQKRPSLLISSKNNEFFQSNDSKCHSKPAFKKKKHQAPNVSQEINEEKSKTPSSSEDILKCQSVNGSLLNQSLKPLFNKVQNSLPSLEAQNNNSLKKPAAIIGDDEINELANKGKLHKVNNASLITYLRKKGVQCKSREKKSDLLMKAQLLFPRLENNK